KPIAMSNSEAPYWPAQDPDPNEQPPLKKRSGCWFWGCLISAVLAIMLGIGGYFMISNLLSMVTDMAVEYSETEAMPIEQSTMSLDDYQNLMARIEAFETASKAAAQPEPLVLSGEDINALIANHPDWQTLRVRAHVELEDDRIHAELSFPLDELIADLPLPGIDRLQGRFLNATGVISLSLRNGQVSLRVHELDFHGKQLPVAIMAELRDGNALQDQQDHPEVEKMRAHANRFWIEAGELKIEPRKPR